MHKPQVFLFDEPLSNLDAKLRLEARGFLKHLQQESGVTAVSVGDALTTLRIVGDEPHEVAGTVHATIDRANLRLFRPSSEQIELG